MWTTVLADAHRQWLHGDDSRGWLRQALTWLREALCGLRGHNLLLHFESHRVCLECDSCGYQTPGWHVTRMTTRTP